MCSAFCVIVVSLLALQLQLRPCAGKSKEAEEFLQRCPPSRCGSGSVEVRYPFRLQTSPPSCGLEGLVLACYGDDALLAPPYAPRPYAVASINYRDLRITVASGSGSACPFQNLTDLSQLPCYSTDSYYVSLLSCPTKLLPGPRSRIAGPVPCSPPGGGAGHAHGGFMYVAETGQLASNLPRDCTVVSTGGELPILLEDDRRDGVGAFSFAELSETFAERREFRLLWHSRVVSYVDDAVYRCQNCERAGDSCGFSWARNQSFCIPHSHGPFALITGTSIGGSVILVSVSVAAVYAYRLWEKKKEICLKVERFLATYDSAKPTRYSYSDIRKMTKQFRHELGEGGFATVYKGELPNGVPVAVKMLGEAGRRGEEDFVNEVATMGRIHHVNVVRLLGFCFEGTRYALVYEFMPNGSLEKFVFSSKRGEERLGAGRLQEIAVGVARGVEYLHRGCEQRILHLDIKPHNVLLDRSLNPKVSDFGLAKLCSRDESVVAVTAARGTMGYAAPEVYLGSFGAVSCKSDVYSFGMLLLEMVSGRKNVEPAVGSQAQVYFPEWAYDRLVNAGDLGLTTGGGGDGDEGDVAKKLVIVALWCIQWYSVDRPSMTRVIQMLTGSLESLEFPPKPFISSSFDQEMEEIARELGRRQIIIVKLFEQVT
ncbi:rust resistance kinase Lr10-like isoform X1 [Iris pallida]|uniref:non-specific serine/threonine protein kinase n=1 Tax=Iris pallida TaxID=29817 RepID=A0AAX6HWS9_IRIPA|nr:rust resistance kinase Lr10-like isoform X1 [Iris pallida]